jgi:hypothetical protein
MPINSPHSKTTRKSEKGRSIITQSAIKTLYSKIILFSHHYEKECKDSGYNNKNMII